MTERPVVVGVDDTTESLTALRWAIDDAESRGLPIRVVHAVDMERVAPAVYGFHRDIQETMSTAAHTMIEKAVDQARQLVRTSSVEGVVVEGSYADVLAHESRDASLLVVGARHLSAWGALLGSVSCAAAARSECPTVVVRWGRARGSAPLGPAGAGGPVVVGLDGSDPTEPVLAYAFDHASRHDRPLHAVMAWERLDVRFDPSAPSEDELVAAGLAGMVEPWRKAYPLVKVEEFTPTVHRVDALVGHAADAELVVVGARGHHARFDTMLGSVSQGVLHHATCPVAVIHPAA